MSVITLRFALTGLGNIGRTLLEVIGSREALLRERFGLVLRAVALADSSGCALDPEGLGLAEVVALKRAGRGVASLPGVGRPGMAVHELLDEAAFDVLLEATPTELRDGQPGLGLVRAALARGIDCVLANKGPLALAYAELAAASDLSEGAGPEAPALRFSGAVGGALPSINVGRRDLAGGRIERVEAVLNSTTQMILGLRARGLDAGAALAEAQRIGIAEPDPTLDVQGWDAACKLVILANAVLGQRAGIADIEVTGIADVGDEDLRAAAVGGGRLMMLAIAQRRGADDAAPDYRLSVAPTVVAAEHPLAHMGLDELGIVYFSDIYGRTTAMSLEDGPLGSAAAMLRDVIEVAARRRHGKPGA